MNASANIERMRDLGGKIRVMLASSVDEAFYLADSVQDEYDRMVADRDEEIERLRDRIGELEDLLAERGTGA